VNPHGVLIGTSGWHYGHWKGHFYPDGLRAGEWLGFYSQRFQTVEVNNAFYRLPTREAFEDWASQTPADFVVAVKASRYLTHIKRLRDPADPVARLLAAARGLGPKLGPVLLQLPPNLRADAGVLAEALRSFPREIRVAVESRHPSWYDEEIRKVLEQNRAAWVWVDPSDRNRPRWQTAGWGYVRFHGGRGSPESCYTRSPLETWARRLSDTWSRSDDVYCYFNNDANGCAPHDARMFAAATRRAGLSPSRVPGRRETSLV
jgi:uncharacterized protein YecE (DUF72 family)